MKQICVIETGLPPDALVDEFGSYPDMGIDLIKSISPGYDFACFNALGSKPLPEPNQYDGYLIMGSEFSVLDDDPWIAKLSEFVRSLANLEIPMIGICFGHQLIAQALGGIVERRDWIIGQVKYATTDDPFPTLAYHQDQVIRAPIDGKIVMTSEACPIAALEYRSIPAWSIQAHPEFSETYMPELIEQTRHKPLTAYQTDQALQSLNGFIRDNSAIRASIKRIFPNAPTRP